MQTILLQKANVFLDNTFKKLDVLLVDGCISEIAENIEFNQEDGRHINCDHLFLSPAFCDVHVHLREPGFSYKATIASETKAALAGGFTTLASMPNLKPFPDSLENLQVQLDMIEEHAKCRVIPYACITKGESGLELADMEQMAPYVGGFSDDGRGVQDDSMMAEGFKEAKRLGKPIVAHAEVEALVRGGVIHDGVYAKMNNFPGNPSESEWKMVERDLALVEKYGTSYHVCHVSTKETVQLVREAKAKGLPVTCETAQHYLYFTDEDLQDEGRFKMNPPIRAKEDQDALIQGLMDGTVDLIATDHAPHAADEKNKGLLASANGIVGLETAFAAAYTAMVKPGHISLERLIQLMSVGPRAFLGLDSKIAVGEKAEFVLLDITTENVVSDEHFLSMGKASPFVGETLQGQVVATFYNGELVWEKEN